jgi:hypothetical protein
VGHNKDVRNMGFYDWYIFNIWSRLAGHGAMILSIDLFRVNKGFV